MPDLVARKPHLREPEDAADGFGVADASGEDHCPGDRQGEEVSRDFFVGFRPGWAGLEIARKIYSHSLVEEAGAGVKIENTPPASGGIAGFFEQLAASGSERRLALVNAAGGQFPHHGLCGVAVLSLEKNERFGGTGFDAAFGGSAITPAIAG